MRRAHFIVGFSNWGKTTLIYNLFGNGDRRSFSYSKPYSMDGVETPNGFMVQSQSNDDLFSNYGRFIKIRLDNTHHLNPDLIAALCPTLDKGNNFQEILSERSFDVFDEFHFYLIKYRYEHHAQLLTEAIIKSYNELRPNTHFHIIDADETEEFEGRLNAKVKQTKDIFKSIYSK